MVDTGACVPCLRKGHSCVTANQLEGQYVCVFCEDDMDCPVIQREKKMGISRSAMNAITPTAQAPIPKAEPATPAKESTVNNKMAPPICSVPGCGKKLRRNGAGEYNEKCTTCTKGCAPGYSAHPGKNKPKKLKQHKLPKAAPPSNPSPEQPQMPVPDRAALMLTREELSALFNSWPIERQAAAVQAVFVQELGQA